MKKGVVAVDLFCGAGGLTRGLLDSGIKVVKGYDTDTRASETYEKNNQGAKFFSDDVSSVSGEKLLENINLENNFFLLAGCAPCQPFSLINRSPEGRKKEKNLLLEFKRLVEETEPDFIFMENVPGLMNGRGKNIFSKFLKTLEEKNYFYDYDILNTMYYEVPQRRRRLVLIASKHSEVKIPAKRDFIIKLADKLRKYPPIKAGGGKKSKFLNHQARSLSELNIKRLKLTKRNGGSRTDLPEELVLECHKKHTGHKDVYGRMSFDNVSPTLTCRCTCLSNGRFGHPTQNRAISVREAAAIQTFEDGYEFLGNMSENTRWVGNAVPVKFAKTFGDYFMEIKNSISE